MNILLEYFGVKNHEELLEYIKNRPDDPKSKELLEIMAEFGLDVSEAKDD